MDQRKPLNVDACNHEEMRAVVRDADANFSTVFAKLQRLRTDHDDLIRRLIGARPT